MKYTYYHKHSHGLHWIICLAIIASVAFSLSQSNTARAATDYTAWNDLGIVYTAPSGNAYYPSVLYDAAGFGVGSRLYKMWYSDGSGQIYLTTSTNGSTWGAPTSLNGLGGDAHHVQVLYDAGCFGVLPCEAASIHYKIWYWDTDTSIYSINAIASAESSDGLNWINDQAITQDASLKLVTGVYPDWNYGTYGPISLFYQAGASNSGANPWNYSYVMYYDGTDGSSEVTGLAYSADGLFWMAYTSNPVLKKGSGNAWDCDDAVYGTVYRDANGYHYWYSGGGGDNGLGGCQVGDPVSEGFGYASSADGFNWSKDAGNPIFHISDGVSYRDKRTYTPAFVNDGSGTWKLYYSAQATGSGQPVKIALAQKPGPTAALLASFDAAPSEGNILLAWQTTLEVDILGFYIYRADAPGGEYQRLNSELIPSAASGLPGASYTYLDTSAQPGRLYHYRLEVVSIHAASTYYGPLEALAGWRMFIPLIMR